MASSCVSKLAKFCRRCRARSDLYPGAGAVWTVYELACFVSPLRCGSLREHSRQVPAVFADLWMVPLFISSTEWWILLVCYRDRYAQCRTVRIGLVIDVPVAVHVEVVDNTVVGAEAVSLDPAQETTEIPQLQSIDMVFDVPVCRSSKFSGAVGEETVELPQLRHVEKIAAWTLLWHARCVQRQMPGGSECRKLRRSRHYLRKLGHRTTQKVAHCSQLGNDAFCDVSDFLSIFWSPR